MSNFIVIKAVNSVFLLKLPACSKTVQTFSQASWQTFVLWRVTHHSQQQSEWWVYWAHQSKSARRGLYFDLKDWNNQTWTSEVNTIIQHCCSVNRLTFECWLEVEVWPGGGVDALWGQWGYCLLCFFLCRTNVTAARKHKGSNRNKGPVASSAGCKSAVTQPLCLFIPTYCQQSVQSTGSCHYIFYKTINVHL